MSRFAIILGVFVSAIFIVVAVSVVIHLTVKTPVPLPPVRALNSASQYLKPVKQPANGTGF